jgi:hypothetical protein
MKLYDFYKTFEKLPPAKRFQAILPQAEATSMFEIFQRLTHVRAQQRYYEKMEQQLLRQAAEGFTQINNGK